jgi:hypothetical protein
LFEVYRPFRISSLVRNCPSVTRNNTNLAFLYFEIAREGRRKHEREQTHFQMVAAVGMDTGMTMTTRKSNDRRRTNGRRPGEEGMNESIIIIIICENE